MADSSKRMVVLVHGKGIVYGFEAIPHLTDSKANRLIDAGFYTEHCNGGFEGAHYELELTTDVGKLPNEKDIHFYRTPSGKSFVCWTGHLPDYETALRIFTMWCVGTTYTIVHGEDFAKFYENDPEKLIADMAPFGIELAE